MISKDLGKYFKINVHSKKVEFKNFYTVGKKPTKKEDYRSDNTQQLDIVQTLNLLKKVECCNLFR